MLHTRVLSAVLLPLAACILFAAPEDTDVVFRSDVSLVRVDTQVVDRDNRAIAGLREEDFVIRDEGRKQPIRNFARENMPLDILFLFDVSASMRPHVQRIADAAQDAFRELRDKDRVGIMVFDRVTRLRLAFNSNQHRVESELDNMLREESFRGGTDITRGMLDAADYVRREGRKDARRAIVILTDDETEFNRDDEGVGRALERGNIVMSSLIAPDAMGGRYGHGGGAGGGSGNGGGGTWGNGGGIPGLGGIILGGGGMGRRGGYGNRGGGPHTKSAGTAAIARASGGDSYPVDDASALDDTLARLRQRYALYFQVPPGAQAGQERNIEVALSDAALRRYPDAELRFRRTYVSPSTTEAVASGPAPESAGSPRASGSSTDVIDASPAPSRRRKMVSEPDGPHVMSPGMSEGQAPQSDTTETTPAGENTHKPTGSWRKVKPDEDPSRQTPPQQQ